MNKETIVWEDIQLVVVFKMEEAHIDFDCYQIVGHVRGASEKFDVPLYERKYQEGMPQDTEDIEQAQTIIRGYIKWDSCSHVYFGDDNGYIHLCGKSSWEQVQKGLERIFAYAKEHLEKDHSKNLWD